MTKRKIFGLTAGIAIVIAAAIVTTSSINARSITQSDLLTKNLEALSQGELGNNGNYKDVYYASREVYYPDTHQYVKATVLVCEGVGDRACN